MGGEFKRKGVNVLLGPVVGPAWSVVKGGRNWEGASADVYLSGVMAAQTVLGVQSANVMTSTKVSESHCPKKNIKRIPLAESNSYGMLCSVALHWE